MRILPKTAVFYRFLLMVILAGFLLSGCSHPAERLHPQFTDYRHPMGTMLVLMPEIGIFEQLPGGSRLFQDVQSRDAQRIAQQSIVVQLQKRHFRVQPADVGLMQKSEIKSLTSLFRSVNRSIQLHTFGPQIYPAKVEAFEYQLGPVADILKARGADGLVVALGHQTGASRPVRNWLSIAVVEPQGRIIWFGVQGDHLKYNLQSPESVAALVGTTMTHFWESGS